MTRLAGARAQRVQVGANQLTIHALAQHDTSSPVAIVLPAMGVPARYYLAFVRHLHDRGLTPRDR